MNTWEWTLQCLNGKNIIHKPKAAPIKSIGFEEPLYDGKSKPLATGVYWRFQNGYNRFLAFGFEKSSTKYLYCGKNAEDAFAARRQWELETGWRK